MKQASSIPLRNFRERHHPASASAGWSRLSGIASRLLDLSAEQLIAFSRLILAVFALAAIWLDPTQPAAAELATYAILGVYLLYALAILAIVLASSETRAAWFVHAIDIATFSLLMHLTAGPTSPFFVLFVFALFSATLRWTWRGALGTGLILVGLYVLLGFVAMPIPIEENELNTTIIRAGYLVVSAGILVYLGALRERSQRRIALLADWPAEGPPEDGFPALRGSLSHAVEILRAKKLVVLWESAQEPFVYCAEYSPQGGYATRLDPPERCHSPLPAIERPLVVEVGSRPARPARAAAPGEALRARICELLGAETGRVAVAPIAGERFRGLALVLEPSRMTMNVLPLTQIVAARICGEIGHFNLNQELAAQVALRERARVARDVHDGLLQALAAIGMQLRAVADAAPHELKPRLHDLERVVRGQQAQLRALVSSARASTQPAEDVDIAAEIPRIIDGLKAQWRCGVTLEVVPPGATAPAAYRAHLPLMISEAVANAVRHGGAEEVAVRVSCRGETIVVDVCNVHAAPGRRSCDAAGGLPRSLAERVRELGGEIALERKGEISALRIRLPGRR